MIGSAVLRGLLNGIAQFTSIIGVDSLQPMAEKDRSPARYRRMLVNTISSLIAKGVLAGTTLVSVPIVLHGVGPERFGLWATLTSLIPFLTLADLGIGNALVNVLARSAGRNDRSAAASAVSTAFFVLSTVGAVIVLGYSIVQRDVDWSSMFGLRTDLARMEVQSAVAVLVVVMVVQLPVGIVQRVQEGHQEGFKSTTWQALGYLLGLVLLLGAVGLRLGVPWLVLAVAGAPLITNMANAWRHFTEIRAWLRPRWSAVSAGVARELLSSGGVFLSLGILTFVGLNSDNLVIARVLGSAAVSDYAVVERLSRVAFLFQVAITALWPAYGEALARGEYSWVRRTFRRSLGFSVMAAVAIAVFLVMLGPGVLEIWVGTEIHPPSGLIYGFGAYIVMSAFFGNLVTVFNSGPFLRRQLWLLALTAPTALILKVAFLLQFGVAGAVWATVVAFSVLYVVPGMFIVNSSLTGQPRNRAVAGAS